MSTLIDPDRVWVIAKAHVLELNGGKVLSYILIDLPPFDNEEKAIDGLAAIDMSIGWVVIKLSQIISEFQL